MSEVPTNFSPLWSEAQRPVIPMTGGERETLTAMLDWHRATLEAKCAGVPAQRLSEKNIPPSGLSLHGIVRHLAGCERWWFQIQNGTPESSARNALVFWNNPLTEVRGNACGWAAWSAKTCAGREVMAVTYPA